MIVLDEERLRNETLIMIAEDYYLPKKEYESYDEWLDRVVDRLRWEEK